ncbi:MAG: hypothetical protein HC904_12530 [Blastochloris sp.]|nr:hypothetical protein [Blastochloris sp.]
MLAALIPAAGLWAEESPAPTLQSAWKEAASLLVNDSNRSFNQVQAGNPQEERELAYGQAATLINVQPKTNSNMDRAKEMLNRVIAGGDSDDLTVSSRYLLARIAQVHQLPPDDGEAIRLYSDLINKHPDHVLAQQALVKRANLQFFSTESKTPLQDRYALLLKEAGLVTEAEARRDYQMLAFVAGQRLNRPARELLGHLIQVEATGVVRDRALADLYVRLGEFANLAGEKKMAIHYYQTFLNGFVRDTRRLIVREKLAELGANPEAAQSQDSNRKIKP